MNRFPAFAPMAPRRPYASPPGRYAAPGGHSFPAAPQHVLPQRPKHVSAPSRPSTGQWQPKPTKRRPMIPPRPYAPKPIVATAQPSTFTLPAPTIRAQGEDKEDFASPPSSANNSLVLPAPEALGVSHTPTQLVPSPQVSVDWNTVRAKLHQLGATSFNLSKLTDGSYRMVVMLPTSNPQQNRIVESVAVSEASAVATALSRAAQLRN